MPTPPSLPAFDRHLVDVDFHRIHRVRWHETDATGNVHFANYVRYMEETEYAFLRSRGLSVEMQDERGIIGFPRVSCEFSLQTPAQWNDLLEIWMKLVENNGVKLTYQFEIGLKETNRDIEAETMTPVVATGTFVVACCRFPSNEPPRAILIPDYFSNRLPRS